MALSASLERFHQIIDKYQDPRSQDWFLISSPIPTIALVLGYLFTIKVLLPPYMRNRKPYQLKTFITIYNFIQVLSSIYLVNGFLINGWLRPRYSSGCILPSVTKNIIHYSYFYFLLKFTEFIDTITFVLRKKDSQVSNLHVYHHSVTPLLSWLSMKYAPDSQMTYAQMINSFVHIIMYTYYLLSGMGPKIQKYLWWKKYVTIIQLVQFASILLLASQAAFLGCNTPKGISYLTIIQSVTFFVMFFNFYRGSYKDGRSKNHKKKEEKTL